MEDSMKKLTLTLTFFVMATMPLHALAFLIEPDHSEDEEAQDSVMRTSAPYEYSDPHEDAGKLRQYYEQVKENWAKDSTKKKDDALQEQTSPSDTKSEEPQ